MLTNEKSEVTTPKTKSSLTDCHRNALLMLTKKESKVSQNSLSPTPKSGLPVVNPLFFQVLIGFSRATTGVLVLGLGEAFEVWEKLLRFGVAFGGALLPVFWWI